jgi:hypothetical protein
MPGGRLPGGIRRFRRFVLCCTVATHVADQFNKGS